MSDRALRVAIDGRCLEVEHLRGVNRSLAEFIHRTSASGAIEWHVLSNRRQWPAQWEQYGLPAAATRLHADVLHAPGGAGPWWQPVPTVITIANTQAWQSSDHSPGFYRNRVLPAAFHRARAIVTISDMARRDILARWPALKPRLHVISPGVDDRYLDAPVDRRPVAIAGQPVAGPYLLYIGSADPRQRLMWALQSWWSGAAAGATMVVCGLEAGDHEAVRNTVPRAAQPRLILAPFVSEDEMPRLIMGAAAVLYPTLENGFGLPVIEAQAVGTPVLFSDTGSLSELKGPGAVVLPVDDLAAWVRMTGLLVQSRSSAGAPDHVARAWASQYSWDAYASRMLDVYSSVAAAAQPAIDVNSPTPFTDRTSP